MAFTIKHTHLFTGMLLMMTVIGACTPESSSQDLGSLPVASFTATPLAGNPNKIAVQSTTKGGFMWRWDYGNSDPSKLETDTFTFPKKGDYAIQLTAFTKGGSATAVQKVSIANDLPPVDILKGGDMSAGSEAYWTVLNTGGTQTSIVIANGVMNFSNTGNTNGAIYQAVTVKANRNYTLVANVKGSGATNTWFEVYMQPNAPVQGSDYAYTKYVAMNTWAGCGSIPFDGNIAVIGCDGDSKGKGGNIKFATAGTIYILFKAGSSGGTMGAGGFDVDNVQFLEEQ